MAARRSRRLLNRLAMMAASFCGALVVTSPGSAAPPPPPAVQEISAGQRAVPVFLPDGAIASLPLLERTAATRPALVVLLHGAGQTAEQMIAQFARDPDLADAVLLAPKSVGATWDVISKAQLRQLAGTTLSSDVLRYTASADGDRIDAAIDALEKKIPTDPSRRFILGFSDGATFALAFGTGRAHLFAAIVALSPGLSVVAARPARHRPVLVMHGKRDRALPFEFTRTTIVPLLKSASLEVKFVPFDGGHEIPARPFSRLMSAFTSVPKLFPAK